VPKKLQAKHFWKKCIKGVCHFKSDNIMENTVINFDFEKSPMYRMCLQDAYDAVTALNLWEYLKHTEFESFTYYNGPNIELHDQLLKLADKHNVHSGASYGITMRNMEGIAKKGFEAWKAEYISKKSD
jgi:hypothetical protein